MTPVLREPETTDILIPVRNSKRQERGTPAAAAVTTTVYGAGATTRVDADATSDHSSDDYAP